MTDINELQHLLEVLRKYNLPVSPILEYAIKEKIDQLSSDGESRKIMSVIKEQKLDDKVDVYVEKPIRVKKKPSTLRVIRSDGTAIENTNVASTFCQAIKEIGAEKVYALKIPMDSMHLVTLGGNPQYPSAQHDIGGGYFVNVHSNTITKLRQLKRIFSELDVDWSAEIVEYN